MPEQAGKAGATAAIARMAWAKVNLYLHVTGRRTDGYHTLDSLVVFVAVGDRLCLAADPQLRLLLDGPFAGGAPPGPENLVLRAAVQLRERTGVSAGALIRLTKELPVAAGIGGGSADAAATLDGLVSLWRVNPGERALSAMAAGLGADVPACRYGRPAFIAGIGEQIERAPPLPPAWLVLVNPGLPLSTPQVFRARSGPFSEPGRWTDVPATAEALGARLAARSNDLEAPARRLVPMIDDVLDALGSTSGCLLARMSGSGTTCFGLFASQDQADAAAAAIAATRSDWWTRPAPILHGRLDRLWHR